MFWKIFIFVIACAGVWYGFKWLDRRDRLGQGDRKPAERSMGDRLRKKMREKTGTADPNVVEDMEQCPKCGAYFPVGSDHSCR